MVRQHTSTQKANHATIKRLRLPCAICGEPIDYTVKYPHPDSFVVDHIVPLAAGGTDHITNCQPTHRRCNSAKSARPFAPIIRRCGSLR